MKLKDVNMGAVVAIGSIGYAIYAIVHNNYFSHPANLKSTDENMKKCLKNISILEKSKDSDSPETQRKIKLYRDIYNKNVDFKCVLKSKDSIKINAMIDELRKLEAEINHI